MIVVISFKTELGHQFRPPVHLICIVGWPGLLFSKVENLAGVGLQKIRIDAPRGCEDDFLNSFGEAIPEEQAIHGQIRGAGGLVEVNIAAPSMVGGEMKDDFYPLYGLASYALFEQIGLRDFPILGMGGVAGGDYRLLDFRAGEAIGRRSQRLEIETGRIQAALLQVNPQDVAPDLERGKIDEKDFIEAPLADHLRWQPADFIGSSHDEHGPLAFGHPRQQHSQHAPREAVIIVAYGKALFDFVQP